MAKRRSDLRLLLLQIRDDPRVRREEHASFVAQAGLAPHQIEILNVFDTPAFPPDAAADYDALVVGGASEASVLEPERYPFVGNACALLHHARHTSLPVFASCFGFQLAVIAFGGEIIRDEVDFEIGTIPIRLTSQAASDPILHDTPDGFLAVSVHRERSVDAPEGCTPLAYTDPCCHVFRVEGQPFWAFQFHPEVDRATLIERLTVFKAHYTTGDDHLKQVLDRAQETPESNHLVAKFVDRVLLGERG